MESASGQLGASPQSRGPQQNHAWRVGRWLFVALEMVLFGGLIGVYLVYRGDEPEQFAWGSTLLDTGWGAISTSVLIIGSMMMALAVRSARCGHRSQTVLLLALTVICAVDVLGVRYIEYRDQVVAYSGWTADAAARPAGATGLMAAGELPPLVVEPGVAAEGAVHYRTTCLACHGPGGEGLVNFGRPLTTSVFIAERSDTALTDFLRRGRSIDDPLNTTGIPMAPRGGNPTLTDQDLANVVAFVRTLQTEETVTMAGDSRGEPEVIVGATVEAEPMTEPPPPLTGGRFFSFYYLLTGIHALHVLVGMGLTAWLMWRIHLGRRGECRAAVVGGAGLYWHSVNVIWILLFPLLYLIG